jgi:hypothetical protein
LEGEVVPVTGIYSLEYVNDMSIKSFLDANTILQYENGEIATHFDKTIFGYCKGL